MNNAITERGVLIIPQICLWSGRKHVSREELGVKLPKGVVTPGSKRIAPPGLIRPMETIKSKTITALEKVSVSYGKGVFILDEDILPEVLKTLEDLKAEFGQAVADMQSEYAAEMQSWLPTIKEDAWRQHVSQAALSSAEAASRYGYAYSVLRVNPPEAGAEASGEVLKGLKGRMWKELAEIAKTAMERMAGNGSVTQKAKSPFRRMAEKAQAVAFIDPRGRSLAGYIEAKLGDLPKTGKLSGNALGDLQILAGTLSEPDRALEAAMAFNVVNAEHELDVTDGESSTSTPEERGVTNVHQVSQPEPSVEDWGFF